MTDFRSLGSLGERVQAVRKARGLSVRELALAIDGVPTQATIENIELGRKASIDVTQLMNIAMALSVPLVYLLAPVGRPSAPLDLPGLSHAFDSMTAVEFDAWLGGLPAGAYRSPSIADRSARAELEALREWVAQRADVTRLQTMLELEGDGMPDQGLLKPTRERLAEAKRVLEKQSEFLRSAGWDGV